MRELLRDALEREVTMPKWALFVDVFYRVLILAGAILVAFLWFQAATRSEEEDRNARISACASEYAATFDAHLGLILEEATSADGADDAVLAAEGAALAEMAKRRVGLAAYVVEVVVAGHDFECPPIPEDLVVEGIAP